MFKLKLVRWTEYLFRFAIAALLAYFGYLAVTQPALEANRWIGPEIYNIIISFVDIEMFMRAFGVLQIITALMLIFGKALRMFLGVTAFMLAGIVLTLGFNEIAYRDAVLFAGVLYLWVKEF